jgi:zinc/manganese transport system substrate-binding protein
MMKRLVFGFAVLFVFGIGNAESKPLKIVAAENFYGDIAAQIGGADVEVKSVLTNPGQDPHLFEASPSLARDVAEADIVILNGAGYDPWMEKLLAAVPSTKRRLIVAADLARRKQGDNPHLWYDFGVTKAVAKSIAENLTATMPEMASDFEKRDAAFAESLQPLVQKIAEISHSKTGVAVAATEPVFGYMLEAMGLDVREKNFQLAVMNEVEPAVSDVAKFESDLKSRSVKLLVYNTQASSPLAEKMLGLAQAGGISIIGVTETMPPGKTYQAWMNDEINSVAKALEANR